MGNASLLRTLRVSLVVSVLAILTQFACTAPPDPDFAPLAAEDSPDPARHASYLAQQGEAITGQAFVPGNDVQLLWDGNQTFPAMLAAIKHAKHYIYMESFTFDEKAGKQFADVLIKRRKAGVKVALIYDAFGSSDTPAGIFDYLRGNGVVLTEYNPIGPLEVVDGEADHRDHRKLLIVDGQVAFVGGVNISAVYLHKKAVRQFFADGDPESYKHLPWRDTHIAIRGPAVDPFIQLFRNTWAEQHGDDAALGSYAPRSRAAGDVAVQAVYGAPQHGEFKIYESLLLAIALAQRSVHLTTGYFVPTPGLKKALIAAARRGVDVTLLLPSASDSDLALAAGHADYSELLQEGIKIYEFQNEVLHAKTAVIDGLWSTVGSSNLDWRSAVINNECNAVLLGAAMGGRMESMFQDDLLHSQRITAEEWAQRPMLERLHEFKATLMDYFL